MQTAFMALLVCLMAMPLVSAQDYGTPEVVSPAEETNTSGAGTDESQSTTPVISTPNPSSADVPPTELVTPATIAWTQSYPVTCDVIHGDPTALKLNDSAVYICQATVLTTSAGDIPADIDVLWDIEATYNGDVVSLDLPPESSATLLSSASLPSGNGMRLEALQDYSPDGQQTLAFEMVVQRTSCAAGDASLLITVDPSIAPNDVVVTDTDSIVVSAQLVTTSVVDSSFPTVVVDATAFDPLKWNGSGWGTTTATATITVTKAGCSTNAPLDLILSIASADAHLESAHRVDSVSGSLVSMESGDIVAHIPAGFQGTEQVSVTLLLSPTTDVMPGSYQLTIDATVRISP